MATVAPRSHMPRPVITTPRQITLSKLSEQIASPVSQASNEFPLFDLKTQILQVAQQQPPPVQHQVKSPATLTQ
jgi:hypothetical protein